MKATNTLTGTIFSMLLALIITVAVSNAQASQAEMTRSNAAQKNPLVFETREHDFGEIFEGDKVTYAFKFKNSGDKPVKLGKVSASCGCTATAATRGEITPGQEGEVVATFNSTGRRGKQHKSIYVETDGNYPKQTLQISATIIIQREILPDRVNFGTVRELQSSKQTVTIYNRTDEPWTFTEYTIKENERIKILNMAPEPPFTIPAQGRQSLIFTMVPQLTGQPDDFTTPITGGIFLSTDDKKDAKMSISYRAELKQDLMSSPKRVYFPGVEDGATMTKTVSLSNQTSGPITILKYETSKDIFEVLLKDLPTTINKGSKINVPVRFKGNISENSVSAMLKLITDSARQPVVEIPVTALLRNRVTYDKDKQ